MIKGSGHNNDTKYTDDGGCNVVVVVVVPRMNWGNPRYNSVRKNSVWTNLNQEPPKQRQANFA